MELRRVLRCIHIIGRRNQVREYFQYLGHVVVELAFRIGDYFLRVLLQEDASLSGCENADDDPILKLGNASEFFNDLYHRFLLTPKVEMKCLCLQAMAVVYGRNYADIGPFNDTKYIVAMLERVS